MKNEDPHEQAIATLKRKRKFVDDVGVYVAVNGVLWLIWALTGHPTDDVPWPVWPTAIWGFFVLLDAWKLYGPWPSRMRGPITEEEIQQEMRRYEEAPHH
jgi:hypothetical protein